jgi:hypothetical protein
MDRRLQDRKRQLPTRRYGRTKPGTLLKHHIPLKTDRWDVTVPGYTAIDLVAHCGDRGDGEFAHSLNLTDIHTRLETVPGTSSADGTGHLGGAKCLEFQGESPNFFHRGLWDAASKVSKLRAGHGARAPTST